MPTANAKTESCYQPASSTVTMTSADTEYSVTFEHGDREILCRLSDTAVAWRWSWTSGVVAAGGGTPMKAGEAFALSGPIVGATLYFASSSAAMTMNIAKLRA